MGVAAFSGHSGCVNMIQLFAAAKVGGISACSDGSSPFQFTITGLSSSAPYVIFALLREIGEEERGHKTRLANVGFCSKKFGGFAKNLP